LSFPSAKKPRKRLSGDQNGKDGFSVPGSACIERESRARIQRRFLPEASLATNAILRPSGDKDTPRRAVFSGRTMEERIGRESAAARFA
jgi:hypothetical protein